jgi:cysteine-rich repeat protein
MKKTNKRKRWNLPIELNKSIITTIITVIILIAVGGLFFIKGDLVNFIGKAFFPGSVNSAGIVDNPNDQTDLNFLSFQSFSVPVRANIGALRTNSINFQMTLGGGLTCANLQSNPITTRLPTGWVTPTITCDVTTNVLSFASTTPNVAQAVPAAGVTERNFEIATINFNALPPGAYTVTANTFNILDPAANNAPITLIGTSVGVTSTVTLTVVDCSPANREVCQRVSCPGVGGVWVNQRCVIARCGDGVVTSLGPDGVAGGGNDEQCDDGNQVNTDSCRNTCQLPRCGDSITDNGEQCDSGGATATCTAECTLPRCGDRIQQGTEQCDDGPQGSASCTVTCRMVGCGDGVLAAGEVCDTSASPQFPVTTDTCAEVTATTAVPTGTRPRGSLSCSADCQTIIDTACVTGAVCGNGVREDAETCDDGNLNNNDACTNACRTAVCGDGFLSLFGADGVATGTDNEVCDDGNRVDTDSCTNACRVNVCGDGFVNAPLEQCDDGNQVDTDACSNTCRNVCIAPPVGLINWWRGDGNAQDSEATTPNVAVLNNGAGFTTVVNGRVNQAFRLNAGAAPFDDFIRINYVDDGVIGNVIDDSLNFGDRVYSVSAWFRTTITAARQTIIAQGDQNNRWFIELPQNSNGINVAICRTGQNPVCGNLLFTPPGNVNLRDGEWHQVTVTFDRGGDMILYVDGQNRLNTDIRAYGPNLIIPDEDRNLYIGAFGGATPSLFFNGDIDEVVIFNRVLTATEVTALFQRDEGMCRNERCGDGIVQGTEQCDDGNIVNTDRCTNSCRNAVCGDGVRQPNGADGNFNTPNDNEACDDGNLIDNDGCTNSCQLPRCRDGIIQVNGANGIFGDANDEQCDDGNNLDTDSCTATCQNPRCGDQLVQAGVEACDDGNINNNDGCSNNCALTSCGNGRIDANEQCDDGNSVNNDGCTNRCFRTSCGNGVTDGTEQCDDANGIDNDGCRNDCTLARCGNSVVEPGEACDDGNDVATDACNACAFPTCAANNVVDATEQCDDNNAIDTDVCTNRCLVARCGDGIVRDNVEACDDGNVISTDACTSICTIARCGDGYLRTDITDILDARYEQCDDGNNVDTDACSNTCRIPGCGNGILEGTEVCDDGNRVDTDSCRNSCRRNVCGDGSLNQVTEQCDDGNGIDIDGCSNQCVLSFCTDGVRRQAEECDEDNRNSNDACLNTCVAARCGDGIQRMDITDDANVAFEACDDGNNIATDACINTCRLARCGDGFVQNGVEQCDDGNGVDNDACSNTCLINPVQCLPRTSGLVGWWTGDGTSNNFVGAAGFNNGNLVGLVAPQTGFTTTVVTEPNGRVGQSFNLDGTDDHVSGIGAVGDFSFVQNTGVFTIMAWTRSDNIARAGIQPIVSNIASPVAGNNGFYLVQNPNRAGTIDFALVNGATQTLLSSPAGSIPTSNRWYHVVVIGDGTNIRIFIDGVLVRTGPVGLLATGNSAFTLRIGASYDADAQPLRFFDGNIDEVQIYNRALTPAQIRDIFTVGSAGLCKSTCGNGQIEAGEQCEGTNFGANTCFSVNGAGFAANTQGLTCSNTCQVVATGCQGLACVAETPALTNGRVAWWTADGVLTNQVIGIVPPVGPLVETGGVTFTSVADGRKNQALRFNGVNNFVSAGLNANLAFAQNPFTISAWVFNSDTNQNRWIMSRHNVADNNGWRLGVDNQNRIIFVDRNTGTVTTSGTTTITQNVWTHVTVTRGAGNVLSIYVNENLVGTGVAGGNYNDATSPFYVGRWNGPGDMWNGRIDEVAVWNRALTLAEVTSISRLIGICREICGNTAIEGTCSNAAFNTQPTCVVGGGTWTGETCDGTTFPENINCVSEFGVGFTGNLACATDCRSINRAASSCRAPTCVSELAGITSWWTGDGVFADQQTTNNAIPDVDVNDRVTFSTPANARTGRAFVFDGNNDLRVNYDANVAAATNTLNFGTRDYTIAAWVRTNVVGRPILTQGTRDSNWVLSVLQNGQVAVQICRAGVTECAGISSTAVTINDNEWHHVAATFDRDGNLILYVDGQSRGTAVAISAYNNNVLPADDRNLFIGSRGGNAPFFSGSLDEILIFNRVLPATGPGSIASIAQPVGMCRIVCGNGIIEGGEACDDGNGIDTDECSNVCLPARCGDGIVSPLGADGRTNTDPIHVDNRDNEACDDGNTNNFDGCSNSCQNICVNPPNNFVGWWTADGNANDRQGTNNGNLMGLVAPQTGYTTTVVTEPNGRVAQAFNLNQVAPFDDFVVIDDNDVLEIGTGSFSLGGWVFPTNLDAQASIISKLGVGGGYSITREGTQLCVTFADGTTNTLRRCSANNVVQVNQWHHVIGTFDTTANTVELYVGGRVITVDQTGGSNFVETAVNNALPLRIGANSANPPAQFFQGRIDEMAIWNRALTLPEVLSMFTANQNGMCRSVCGNNRLEQGEACDGALPLPETRNECSEVVGIGSTGNLRCTADCRTDTSTCVAAVCITPPVNTPLASISNWWTFDNTGNNQQSDRVAVLNGNAAFTSIAEGRVNQALRFDGDGDFARVNYDANVAAATNTLNFGNRDYSVSAWFRTNVAGRQVIMGQGDAGNRWLIGIPQNENGVEAMICQQGQTPNCLATTFIPVAPASLRDGRWHHVVATFDRSDDLTLYIDGVSQGNVNILANNNNPINPTLDRNLYIGSFGGGANFFFNGDIDEPTIFNEILTLAEVTTLRTAGVTSSGMCRTVCGNGIMEGAEVCDSNLFGAATCVSVRGVGSVGSLTCNNVNGVCTIATTSCTAPTCGNGRIDAGETCDTTNFAVNSDTCGEVVAGTTGILTCSANCQNIVSTACTAAATCGNNLLDANEACDVVGGTANYRAGRTTCAEVVGFGSTGDLACTNCAAVTTACSAPTTCGNGVINAGEVCDGNVLPENLNTCIEVRGPGSTGTPVCANNCQTVNIGSCTASTCGNNILDVNEPCDGGRFPVATDTCAEISGFVAGQLRCSATCALDTTSCVQCNSAADCTGNRQCVNSRCQLAATESTGSSSNAGGVGSTGGGCITRWECDAWGFCDKDLKQTRICNEVSGCGREPRTETRGCPACDESWTCSLWSDCVNGIETRTCTDEHSCGSIFTKPILQRSCAGDTPQIQQPSGQQNQQQPSTVLQNQQQTQQTLGGTTTFTNKLSVTQIMKNAKQFVKDQKISIIGGILFIIIVAVILTVILIRVKTHKKDYNLDELRDWIGKEKELGTSDADIIHILKDQTGWTKKEIMSAFNSLQK